MTSPYCISQTRSETARKASMARHSAVAAKVDPSTTDKSYTPEEEAWLKACDDYTKATGRKFPSRVELLGVLKGLGYAVGTTPTPSATPRVKLCRKSALPVLSGVCDALSMPTEVNF